MERLKHYRALYAEDESIVRMSISKKLQRYFQEVYTAIDGKEALELYTKYKPDVLFLDIDMPHQNGLDVVKHIRRENKTIPIIIITAYTEKTMLLDAIELHLTKYLVKPIHHTNLNETLEKVSQTLNSLSDHIVALSDQYYWDSMKRKLFQNNEAVSLTHRETNLLELLAKKHKTDISHEEIMAYVWEDKFEEEISMDAVKKLVNRLRNKLPEGCLKSIYGRGYILH